MGRPYQNWRRFLKFQQRQVTGVFYNLGIENGHPKYLPKYLLTSTPFFWDRQCLNKVSFSLFLVLSVSGNNFISRVRFPVFSNITRLPSFRSVTIIFVILQREIWAILFWPYLTDSSFISFWSCDYAPVELHLYCVLFVD